MSRICKLWAEVKREFSDLGEFSLFCTSAPHQFTGLIRAGRAGKDKASLAFAPHGTGPWAKQKKWWEKSRPTWTSYIEILKNYQLPIINKKGAYTELFGIGPELAQNRYVIPAPHPRITVRGKLCAGRESN